MWRQSNDERVLGVFDGRVLLIVDGRLFHHPGREVFPGVVVILVLLPDPQWDPALLLRGCLGFSRRAAALNQERGPEKEDLCVKKHSHV